MDTTAIIDLVPERCKQLLKVYEAKIRTEDKEGKEKALNEFNLSCADWIYEQIDKIKLKEYPQKPDILIQYEAMGDREKEKYKSILDNFEIRQYLAIVSRYISENYSSYIWIKWTIEQYQKDKEKHKNRIEVLDKKEIELWNWLSKNTKLKID